MKKRIRHTVIPLLLLSFFSLNSFCHAKVTRMTIEQLKAERGKGFSASVTPTGSINFSLDEHTNSGIPVSASGTLDILQKTQDISQTSLTLSDSAQQNLQALINVNAVNSDVQVLANITVNINSTIGLIEQSNQASHNQELLTP